MYEANDHTFAMPANPAGDEFEQAWQDEVNKVLTGDKEPADALADAQEAAQAGARRGMGDLGREVSVDRPRRHPRHRRAARPRGRGRHEGRIALLFISPWLIGFVVFMAYPVDLHRLPLADRLRRHQRPDRSSASRTTAS